MRMSGLARGEHSPQPAPVADGAAMTPVPHRIVDRRIEADDVTTFFVVPTSGEPATFLPGQFNMLTAYGVGEAAVSVSGSRRESGPLRHTVRDVGPVTRALCRAEVGDVVGVRGPFGTPWDVSGSGRSTGDTVVVAGGIGLAPLRGAIDELTYSRNGRVVVIVGTRSPRQIIFGDDLEAWERGGAAVAVTVDVASSGWSGHVGLVTSLLDQVEVDTGAARAFVCGPEVMMRFTARALVDRGIDPHRIQVSLERNMQCGLGWCGHCQLGPLLLCRDGPVLTYAGDVAELLTQGER